MDNRDNQPDAIRVVGLSKTFKLPHEKQSSIKSSLINFHKRGYELQKALDDVSFDIKKGEFFGIVGRNGSGKSTLLKMLAGIYVQDKGDIKVNGSLVPFIELGVGFNPELTGRENVFLNGALLGFSRKEIQAMYQGIVDFAEIERFMDQKLKNYSSGMQVRLAFSIAIRAQGDILLLDEVLAVGDSAFQQKCLDYFAKLKKDKKTIVLVSHNMQTIEQFCDRVVFIDSGKIKHIGDGSEVANMYEEMFRREEVQRLKHERSDKADLDLKVLSTKVMQKEAEAQNVDASSDFEVHVTLKSKLDIDKVNVGINIKNRDRIMVIAAGSETKLKDLSLSKNKSKTVVFKIKNILVNGVYTVNVGVADASEVVPKILLRSENSTSFTVEGAESKSLVRASFDIKEL